MKLSDNVIMNDIFWGVNIAIVILMFLTVKEVWNTSIVDKFTLFYLVLFLFYLSLLGFRLQFQLYFQGFWGLFISL